MQEKNLTGMFRLSKIIQLCLLLAIEVVLLIILTRNGLYRRIYSEKELAVACSAVWLLLIFNLACLLYDFFKLRACAAQNQAFVQNIYTDSLTGIPNKTGLDAAFEMYTTPESLKAAGCIMVTISNLREINEEYGRACGDRIITDFCRIFEELGDRLGFVGRNGGNEFVLVIDMCRQDVIDTFLATLNNRILLYNEQHSDAPVEIRFAGILSADLKVRTFSQLLAATYSRLYRLDK